MILNLSICTETPCIYVWYLRNEMIYTYNVISYISEKFSTNCLKFLFRRLVLLFQKALSKL